jgi:hypothetical protein
MNDARDLDALISALYASISGPAGQARDWDRMRALFLARAQMTKIYRSDGEPPTAVVRSVEEYVEAATDLLQERGFFEHEIARRVDRFGCIAHVFSTYEAFHDQADAEPFKRGVNSIQLFHDRERWWITGMIWEDESEEYPLTPEFL